MDQATWREKAERDLKGRALDRLTYRPEPDIDVGPLCSEAPPSSRGLTRAPGWQVVQTAAGPAETVSRTLQRALKGGVDTVRIDCTALRDARDLATCLTAVDLKRTPVHLTGEDAGAAAAMVALWRALGVEDSTVSIHFGLDPLGALAAKGACMGTVESRLAAAAEVGRWSAQHTPQCRAITVDATVWHNAGADESWSMALGIATALAYVRAMEKAGVPVQQAFDQVAIRQAIPGRFFLGMAKLRATRRIWSRIGDLTGITARLYQTATPAQRERTSRDRWVNVLRQTASAFGGIAGGAHAIDIPPYAAADEAGERLARNLQRVLKDEAHLDRITDPAGGSFALESLTDQLARAAWKRLQQIERQGGMVNAVTSGFAMENVAACRTQLERKVRTRKAPILGVSRFPNLDEDFLSENFFEEAPTATPGGVDPTDNFDSLLEDALRAPIPSMTHALHGRGLARAPLAAPMRVSDPFEILRNKGDQLPNGPSVFLATLGPLASHGPWVQFGKEFIEAGGLRVQVGPARDFAQSGCRVAVVAASAAALKSEGGDAIRTLLADGAAIWCLGRPGDNEQELRDGGVRDFLYAGVDTVKILSSLWLEVGR